MLLPSEFSLSSAGGLGIYIGGEDPFSIDGDFPESLKVTHELCFFLRFPKYKFVCLCCSSSYIISPLPILILLTFGQFL